MKSIIPSTWDLPEKILDRFGETVGRQRAMLADGHMILALHAPATDGHERQARLFWRNNDSLWTSNSLGPGIQALKCHIAQFSDLVEQLDGRMQDANCANHYFELLQEIVPLHRNARNLHAALQQARDLIPDDRDLIVLRDSAGDIERALELLHADAKNGLDYTVAQKSEIQSQRAYEMAVSAHRLNMLAAIFFPVTAVSSIFGMNMKNGLETYPNTLCFWGIIALAAVCGIFLAVIIAQRPGQDNESKKERRKVPTTKQKSTKTGQLPSLNLGARLEAGAKFGDATSAKLGNATSSKFGAGTGR